MSAKLKPEFGSANEPVSLEGKHAYRRAAGLHVAAGKAYLDGNLGKERLERVLNFMHRCVVDMGKNGNYRDMIKGITWELQWKDTYLRSEENPDLGIFGQAVNPTSEQQKFQSGTMGSSFYRLILGEEARIMEDAADRQPHKDEVFYMLDLIESSLPAIHDNATSAELTDTVKCYRRWESISVNMPGRRPVHGFSPS